MKYTASIVQKKWDGCFLCGSRPPVIHIHHIMGGPNRKKSTEDGLVVLLCPNCHTEGKASVHRDSATMRYLRKCAQRAYEKLHSHEEWMKRYGRNYL